METPMILRICIALLLVNTIVTVVGVLVFAQCLKLYTEILKEKLISGRSKG